MENQALKRAVMRRVYYSYALSLATHPMLWRGATLGAALVLLADWLHVSSITQNLLATPVGEAPSYLLNSFLKAATGGELLTALTVVLVCGIALSSGLHLLRHARTLRFLRPI